MNHYPISELRFFRKKREIIIYKARLDHQPVLIKCSLSGDPSVLEAFSDEYKVMSRLSHPGIPAYYWFREDFRLPDLPAACPALCMEDCSPLYQPPLSSLTPGGILDLMHKVCSLLSWLLEEGVLYTDLNPSNLILSETEEGISVSLVDYTCCYFFLENPNPAYSLRFSYDLSPGLKGQQLLIQELSFLLEDLIDDRDEDLLPDQIFQLIEAGRRPSPYLKLSDYEQMIQESCRALEDSLTNFDL